MRSLILAALVVLTTSVAQAQQTDSIVIVLDTSGSMGDSMSGGKTRMQVAQDSLITVLKNTPPTTKVGILTFEGWIYDLQKVNQQQLEAAIRSTRPGGGTPLYEYLRAGATRLLEERQSQNNTGYYKLIVVTDGQAGDDSLNRESRFSDGSTKPGVLTDIISRNLIVDVIALDMGEDHDLMRLNNGADMKGNDPASLTSSIRKAVAEVGFGNQKDTSESAFKELDGLPDDFCLAAIKGLTTFRNHPIGEKPPVPIVQADGTVTMQPDPANEAVPPPGEGGGIGGILLIVLVAGVGIVFFLVILTKAGRGY